MSHPEQMQFVADVADGAPQYFEGKDVLEIGSRDVNGSVRQFFTNCRYVGLDCTPGPAVDVVSLAHEYRSPHLFDTIVSCEAFEHDPYLKLTVENLLNLLKPGGLFVGTWASPKRQEHGTLRSTGSEEVYGPVPTYYRGVSEAEFLDLVDGRLSPLVTVTTRDGLDVYAYGFKK